MIVDRYLAQDEVSVAAGVDDKPLDLPDATVGGMRRL
jgi:hypothetical protein